MGGIVGSTLPPELASVTLACVVTPPSRMRGHPFRKNLGFFLKGPTPAGAMDGPAGVKLEHIKMEMVALVVPT